MTFIVRFVFISLLICAAARAQAQPRPASSSQIQTVSGSGNTLVTTTGPAIAGDCVTIDANGNHVDAGTATACGPPGATGPAGATGSAGATGPVGAAAAPPFTGSQNSGTDVICAKGSDTITGITCGNSADATAETTFATSVTLPAGALSTADIPFSLMLGYVSVGTTPTLQIKIRIGGVLAFSSVVSAAAGSGTVILICQIVAASAASTSAPITVACGSTANIENITTRNPVFSNTVPTISLNTSVAETLTATSTYSLNTTGNAVWLYAISPR